MFLPQSVRSSFAPIQHNWQNYSFVYFNLQVFWYNETGRQKILDWIIASIPWIWCSGMWMGSRCKTVLTPWGRVFLGKLIMTQLLKKIHKGLLPYSQEPIIGPLPQPDVSIPQLITLFL
jgi:hypothetical protein